MKVIIVSVFAALICFTGIVRRDFAGGQMARDMTLFADRDGKDQMVLFLES